MVCKYARGKYNITPNDYDLTFDASSIPSNIRIDDVVNLSNHLQSLMPLTKVLHLNLDTSNESNLHQVLVHTSVKLTINDKKIVLEIL